MPITGTTPLSQPAKEFDSYWITTMNIMATSPDKKARASITLVPYNSTQKDDGTHDVGDTPVRISINDLFEEVSTNADLAVALTAVYAAVQGIARSQGKI